jgi:glutathione peroxidase
LPKENSHLYSISAPLLDGQPLSLSHFKGRALLIANTASHCGLTPQYAALEQLYRQFHPRGFDVLAFPCDQFGHQEPGSSTDIAAFCERNYGVTFPVFQKIDVNGPHTHPLFQLLKSTRPGLFGIQRISWNFTKFLIDKNGNILSRHSPKTDPLHLSEKIESLLTAPSA